MGLQNREHSQGKASIKHLGAFINVTFYRVLTAAVTALQTHLQKEKNK